MTDEAKKQAAIDLLISRRYPQLVAEVMVRICGADKILGAEPDLYVPNAEANDAPKANDTHAEECGAVGETGEHGDLGENAK